jgi:GNAT superfamily N-acetyltransferase
LESESNRGPHFGGASCAALRTFLTRHGIVMRIRTAQITDAKAIAQVHVDSWRSTYKGIVPDDFLANLSYERRERGWREILSNAERQRSFVYVAEDEAEKVVGFVNGGPEREDDSFYKGELYAIYLLESYQHKGIGRQLVRVATQQLIERSFETMLVWVLADNPSRRFYERIGGRQVREKKIKIGGVDFVEVVYGWSDIRPLTESIVPKESSA